MLVVHLLLRLAILPARRTILALWEAVALTLLLVWVGRGLVVIVVRRLVVVVAYLALVTAICLRRRIRVCGRGIL